MVGGAGLLADTVGAVRKGDGRDALARQSAGGKDSLAREQGAFLLEIQVFYNVSVFHKILLLLQKERGRAFCPPPPFWL